jgi:hypothetical protein
MRLKTSFRKKKGRPVKIIVAFMVFAIAAIVVNHLLSIVGISIMPGFSSGFKRGFGSTVLNYATPSYQTASWKEVWNIDQVPSISSVKITHISGWDRDNLALAVHSYGTRMFIWKRDGEWIVNTFGYVEFASSKRNRVLFQDKDTLYLVYPDGLHRVTPTENEILTDDKWDFLWCSNPALGNFDTNSLWIKLQESADKIFCLQNEEVTRWGPDEQRSYLREKNGLYAKRRESARIDLVAATSRGTLVGVEWGSGEWKDPARICVFKNNQWTITHEVDGWARRDGGEPNCLWVHNESTMIVGTKQGVRIIRDGRLAQPLVNIAGYDVNVPIIAVWGKDISHYYSLDIKGNIIEYDDTRGRIIARGPELSSDSETFDDAWVSPEGSVFAITEKKVYCFE